MRVEVHHDLDDIGFQQWNDLWRRSNAPSVFARFEWIQAWWRSFAGSRELRIFATWSGAELIGLLATAWTTAGSPRQVTLLGEHHADYAGLLTDTTQPSAFAAMLDALLEALPRRAHLKLPDVRSDTDYFTFLDSLTAGAVTQWTSEEEMLCPHARLEGGRAKKLANKSSLRRKARKLDRLGAVTVEHFTSAEEILPCLPDFFEQHIARWSATEFPSLFHSESDRSFYCDLVSGFSGSGHLIFTRICVDGTPVAYHCGFISEGDFIWYKPSFNPEFSVASPGEVLIRELIKMAGARGLTGFDFTRGDEAFKLRFADSTRYVRTFVRHPTRLRATRVRLSTESRRIALRILPDAAVDQLKQLIALYRRN